MGRLAITMFTCYKEHLIELVIRSVSFSVVHVCQIVVQSVLE